MEPQVDLGREYFVINLSTVRIDSVLDFDLFTRNRQHGQMVLFRAQDLPFTADIRQRLVENGVRQMFVRTDDRAKYRHYVEENMGAILADSHVDLEEKSDLLYSTSTWLMADMFEDPTRPEGLRRCRNMVEHTVDYILSGRDACLSLMSLTSHDYYTYTHSVNVCIYSVMLTREVFPEHDDEMIRDLGTAFLLHDIGKTRVPPEIINKPGPLTPEEWETMRRHPEDGYRILEDLGYMNHDIGVIVMQHHERHDGNGYPHKRKGEDIHIYGKICCIADVFDALTTNRPYRSASSTYDALAIMKKEMIKNFDPDFFAKFVYLFQQ